MSYLQANAERSEAQMILRFAAIGLTKRERLAIGVMLDGVRQADVAEMMGCTRSNISMAQTKGLRKMRKQLARMGFTATRQLLST